MAKTDPQPERDPESLPGGDGDRLTVEQALQLAIEGIRDWADFLDGLRYRAGGPAPKHLAADPADRCADCNHWRSGHEFGAGSACHPRLCDCARFVEPAPAREPNSDYIARRSD